MQICNFIYYLYILHFIQATILAQIVSATTNVGSMATVVMTTRKFATMEVASATSAVAPAMVCVEMVSLEKWPNCILHASSACLTSGPDLTLAWGFFDYV